ncbi:hypothetical protein [Paraburkholderia dilworthii]|uniref:hypothetical protein n=1 Tax=Paraburkholderia dilworthii TaxID=948106 RepID=UPI000422B95A|nr:hypothetical protein [Paraburkholderia dilworthii]
MKVFLLSDLVAQELASMQIDGKWLSFAHFVESSQLWASRHAPDLTLSEAFLKETEREVLEIATRLAGNEAVARDYLQSPTVFDDLLTANYAHPLRSQALSATLAACREKVSCDAACAELRGRTLAQRVASCNQASALTCHPALFRLVRKTADAVDVDKRGGIPSVDGKDQAG